MPLQSTSQFELLTVLRMEPPTLEPGCCQSACRVAARPLRRSITDRNRHWKGHGAPLLQLRSASPRHVHRRWKLATIRYQLTTIDNTQQQRGEAQHGLQAVCPSDSANHNFGHRCVKDRPYCRPPSSGIHIAVDSSLRGRSSRARRHCLRTALHMPHADAAAPWGDIDHSMGKLSSIWHVRIYEQRPSLHLTDIHLSRASSVVFICSVIH